MRTTNDFADDGGDKTRFSDDAIGADMPRERLPILCNDQATVLLRADWPQVSGPLSKATKEAAIQFGQKTRLEAVKVARRHKRAPQEILIHGNLGIRSSCTGNSIRHPLSSMLTESFKNLPGSPVAISKESLSP
jgi:hypothetical protein